MINPLKSYYIQLICALISVITVFFCIFDSAASGIIIIFFISYIILGISYIINLVTQIETFKNKATKNEK